MKKIILLLIIFSAFLLESRISIFGAQPDLAAAIAYYFGLKNGETKGLLFGSFIGLIGDSLSGGILGPNILGKGMVGFFSAFMSSASGGSFQVDAGSWSNRHFPIDCHQRHNCIPF